MRLKLYLSTLLFLLLLSVSANAQQTFVYTDAVADQNLHDVGEVFTANDNMFPQSVAAIDAWQASKKPQSRISSVGGSYWLIVEIENLSDIEDLVLYPYNTLVSKIESRIYDITNPTAPIQHFATGGVEPNQ